MITQKQIENEQKTDAEIENALMSIYEKATKHNDNALFTRVVIGRLHEVAEKIRQHYNKTNPYR